MLLRGGKRLGAVWAAAVAAAVAVAVCGDGAAGLRHDLKIRNDLRTQFFVEQFAFRSGGTANVELLNFQLNGAAPVGDVSKTVGVVLQQVSATSSDASGRTVSRQADGTCESVLAAGARPGTASAPAVLGGEYSSFVVPVSNTTYSAGRATIAAGGAGFYNVFFVSCEPAGTRVSFELKLDLRNEDGYLPAGQTKLPALFFVFSALYLGWVLVWWLRFVRPARANANRMHVLITVLYVLKTLSLFFKAMDKREINENGSPGKHDGWVVLYYIFASLKTTSLFVLIALIGTGFTFVKPFLSDRDKKIFLVIIPLQVLDNIAMIVLEELAPGSSEFSTWKDVFRLVDIICCAAILAPIIWSIKHLREAAQSSGKARASLSKLRLFRQFYLLVVSYIYFTRIIIYLLEATLPFDLTWLSQFAYEVATFAFLVTIGRYFRPAVDNPYFDLKGADSDDEAVQAELLAIEIDSDDAAALHPIDDQQDK